MFIENGISAIAGFLELAVVPIKTAIESGVKAQVLPGHGSARKIALVEEVGGVCVEKLIASGEASAVQPKAMELIQAGRKMALEGFPLEEIASWCFKYNYRWRLHNRSSSRNAFILEPGKNFGPDAEEAGAKN